jgi:hypothetical protein
MSRRDRHSPQPQPRQPTTPQARPPRPEINKGDRFGRWRVARESGVMRGGQRYVPCVCVCGAIGLVYELHLRRGNSTGCGSPLCRSSNG